MKSAMEHMGKLVATLSAVAGVQVEITVRGERSFTVSTEQVNKSAVEKLLAYFSGTAKSISVEHDAECGSFVYLEA